MAAVAVIAAAAALPAIAGPREDAATAATAVQSLIDAGRPAEGEALARRAVGEAEATFGTLSAEAADLYRLLGDTLYEQKRYAEAEPLFRKALAGRQAALGTNHVDTARSHGDLAANLRAMGRLEDAEEHYRAALDIRRAVLGDGHADVARSWFRLARLVDARGDYGRAAALMAEAIAAGSAAFGAAGETVVRWRGERAALLHDSGDLAAAESAYREAIAAAEPVLPPDDPDLANARQGFASLLRQTGRAAEAEPLHRAALASREKVFGPDDPSVASALEGLGRALDGLGRRTEAAEALQRALAIRDATAGEESPAAVATAFALGRALMAGDRPREAEPLFRRVLAAREAAEGPSGKDVADAARWLASAAQRLDRKAEAELLYKRALAIREAVSGPDDVLTGYDLLSLGLLYAGQQRIGEATPLLRRAVAIMEGSAGDPKSAVAARMALAFLEASLGNAEEAVRLAERSLADVAAASGADHPDAADIMVTLAQIRLEQKQLGEAERLAARAQDIYSGKAPGDRAALRAAAIVGAVRLAEGRAAEAGTIYDGILDELSRRYGDDSPELRSALADVGRARFASGDFAAAAAAFERSVAITEDLAAIDAGVAFVSRTGAVEDQAIARAAVYDFLIKSWDRMARVDAGHGVELADKAFRIAQRVIESQAASALAQMTARQAAGDGELAALVRERQDLVAEWQAADRALAALRGGGDRGAEAAGFAARLDAADTRIRAIDDTLSTSFPAFAALQKPSALSLVAARELLAEDEVLLFFADTTQLGEEGFETYLWAVPKRGEVRWVRLEPPTGELSAAVHALRRSMGVGPQARGAQAIGGAKQGDDRTAKVLDVAGALYRATLAPVADMLEGKRLVVVPSKKLAPLPFHLLVSSPPPEGSTDRYRDAGWLARDHAIVVLPSVSALAAVAAPAAAPAAREAYLGFANPLLAGRTGEDRRAFDRKGCTPAGEILVAGLAAPSTRGVEPLPEAAALFRGAEADVAAVRALAPLPETVDEACAVAAAMGAPEAAVRLGADATEAAIKDMSEEGGLARARILHFATHGLVSGELPGLAEPAVVLTPPDEASPRDDGLLTASEVTTLKLDADWVILSACNTASGDGGGEALSGLARAFFYAGARALLVSHWPVNSDAAVSLVTGAVDALTREPAIGRAEALRRAMAAEIGKGGAHADPANWAPFILVGAER